MGLLPPFQHWPFHQNRVIPTSGTEGSFVTLKRTAGSFVTLRLKCNTTSKTTMSLHSVLKSSSPKTTLQLFFVQKVPEWAHY